MKFRVPVVHVYIGVGLAIAIAAIAIITSLAADRQNSQSLATQQTVARFESQDAFDYLRGQTRLMVYWQDAFENVSRHWNQKWVAYQFGPYQDTMGNHLVAIFGPDRRLRFLHASGFEKTFTPENFVHGKGIKALLDVTYRAGLRQPSPIPQGTIVVSGKPYFAVAAFVTPEQQKDLALARNNAHIAVFLKPVTSTEYDSFAAGFDAGNVRITTGKAPAGNDPRYALNDAESHPLAYVRWKPRLPGDAFLQSITLPLIAVFLLLMLTQLMISRRWLKLQHRLIRAEAESSSAKEQSRLKSVFLGTISHELRTPLNAIIGYSDVLCCQIFGPMGSPRNLEYIHDIRDSGRKLLGTVNDLIEIARIEARDTGRAQESFEVTAAVSQAVLSVCPAVDAKSIAIAVATHGKEAWCKGSHISLSQALERVLDNAVRHSPEGSTIEIDVQRNGCDVVLEVKDHGEGISRDRLEDMAHPFGHPDNHLVTHGSKGMGFGIPIARGLVQVMGGTLDIESELGMGTTVRIRLPVQAPAAAGDVQVEPVSVPGVIWTGRGRDHVARRIASSG